jgi:sodium-independent sulfate anion transporter 11
MSDDVKTKVGHGLAKALGIKVPYRDPMGAHADPVTRGESTFSMGTVDTYSYLEPEPTSAEWLKELCPTWAQVGRYFYKLFPFLSWITRYNGQWFLGDMIAGKNPRHAFRWATY